MNCTQAIRMLDAFVDHEVDAATAVEVATHVAGCPQCGTLHGQRLALRSALRSPALRDVAPSDLRAQIVRTIAPVPPRAPPRRVAAWWRMLALAGASALAGGLGGWWVAQPPALEPLPEYAVARHVAALRPEGPRIDVASSDRHTVRPWFQGRVDIAPPVRDLAAQGFELVGGRVERLGPWPAAAVVYRLRGHVVDVYAWRAPGHQLEAERSLTIRGFNVATWNQGDLNFAVVSDMDATEMHRFAAAFRAP